jgi:hypothetical protein
VLKLRVPDLVLSPDHLDDLLKHGFAAAAALSPVSLGGGPYRR